LSYLAPEQADQIFLDEFKGVQFVPAYHKFKGKSSEYTTQQKPIKNLFDMQTIS